MLLPGVGRVGPWVLAAGRPGPRPYRLARARPGRADRAPYGARSDWAGGSLPGRRRLTRVISKLIGVRDLQDAALARLTRDARYQTLMDLADANLRAGRPVVLIAPSAPNAPTPRPGRRGADHGPTPRWSGCP